MKLLVTGGAGFIGSNFIHYWLEKHPQDFIINFDALKYSGNLENLKSVESHPHYTFVQGDITKRQEVDKSFKLRPDMVVNFAAQTHVDLSLHHPDDFLETNVIGTRNLLNASSRFQVKRFHQISTDEVFGDLPLHTRQKFTENTPTNPSNEYAASKAAAEMFVMSYFRTYNLAATISNCTNNIGPYQYPEKLLPLAITNVLEGKKIPVYGTGENIRDWIYVDDHCRAIDVILRKGKPGERYLVGSDHAEISNSAFLKRVLKAMGKGPSFIEFVKDRPGHDRKYAVDWSKIKKLGWRPKYSLDRSIELTVEWYQKNQDWWKKIKSGEYRKNYEKIYKKKYET